jgi:hypothetical protein
MSRRRCCLFEPRRREVLIDALLGERRKTGFFDNPVFLAASDFIAAALRARSASFLSMPCEVSVGPLATRAPLVLLPRVPFASLPALRSSSMMSMPCWAREMGFSKPVFWVYLAVASSSAGGIAEGRPAGQFRSRTVPDQR